MTVNDELKKLVRMLVLMLAVSEPYTHRYMRYINSRIQHAIETLIK